MIFLKLFFCFILFCAVTYAVYRSLNRARSLLARTKKHLPEKTPGLNSVIPAGVNYLKTRQTPFYKAMSASGGFIAGLIFTGSFMLSFVIAAICFFIPGFLNSYREKQRLDKFNNQLIDALTIISNSLRSGASFLQSLDVVAKNTKPPVSEEFTKLSQEIKLGIPVTQALNNMSGCVKSKDLEIFIITVNVARETGGSLPEILTVIADTIRERNKIRGRINALTAQGKMSGYVVSAMPFILMFILNLMAPELVAPMFSTTLGQFMLAVVVALVITGGLLIRKIVTIDI